MTEVFDKAKSQGHTADTVLNVICDSLRAVHMEVPEDDFVAACGIAIAEVGLEKFARRVYQSAEFYLRYPSIREAVRSADEGIGPDGTFQGYSDGVKS